MYSTNTSGGSINGDKSGSPSWCSSAGGSSRSGWGGGGCSGGFDASFHGSSNNNLPKFSDTFGSSGNNLFGDPKKKLDWDGLVDNVFKEEIVKLSDSVRNKS